MGFLGFAQNAIDRGAAHRALALRHTTTRVRNVHNSFELTLLLALNAVGLTLICFSHYFLRSSQVLLPANTLTIPPRHAQILAIHAREGRFLAEDESKWEKKGAIDRFALLFARLPASAGFVSLKVGVGQIAPLKSSKEPFKLWSVIGHLKMNQLMNK